LLGFHFQYLTPVLTGMARHLDAGTAWLSWLLPLAFLVASARRIRAELLPALSLVAGLLLFLVFDYVHDRNDPSVRIGWTLPRVSQPGLSALILAAGVSVKQRRIQSPLGTFMAERTT
jgi:hypothetical protein